MAKDKDPSTSLPSLELAVWRSHRLAEFSNTLRKLADNMDADLADAIGKLSAFTNYEFACLVVRTVRILLIAVKDLTAPFDEEEKG
jgi:hypothetical protein